MGAAVERGAVAPTPLCTPALSIQGPFAINMPKTVLQAWSHSALQLFLIKDIAASRKFKLKHISHLHSLTCFEIILKQLGEEDQVWGGLSASKRK